MRGVQEYEITAEDGRAAVTLYNMRYGGGKEERVPQKRATCSQAHILRLFNDCGLLSWDGFNGKHPRGVLDGIMFRLKATVNGTKTIEAQGSQNFPRHFHEFRDGLYQILHRDE